MPPLHGRYPGKTALTVKSFDDYKNVNEGTLDSDAHKYCIE